MITRILIGLLGLACLPTPGLTQTDRAEIPLEAVRQIVPLRGGGSDGYLAWATPIGPETYLTARHSAVGSTLSVPDGAVKLRRTLPRDLALLDGKADRWLRVATALPEIGAPVLFRGYLMPGAVPTVVRGWFLGVDADDVLHVDAAGSPGTSGSALLDEWGDVIGVVSSGRNPMTPFERGSADWKEALRRLDARSHSRATVLAIPVVGLADLLALPAGGASPPPRGSPRTTTGPPASGSGGP